MGRQIVLLWQGQKKVELLPPPPLVAHFTIIVIFVTHYLVTINITINITCLEKFNKLDQHEPSLVE